MAIPQPGFVGPQQGDVRQQSIGNLGAGFGAATQARQFSRGLAEEQRQYDVTNRLTQYQTLVDSQYGGNWAAFLKGPSVGVDASGNPQYAGNDLAKQMFNDLYGKEGEALYNQAKVATPETITQMTDRILNRKYREPSQQAGGQQAAPPPAGPQGQPISFQLPPGSYQPAPPQAGQNPQGQVYRQHGAAPPAVGQGEAGLPGARNMMAGMAVDNDYQAADTTTIDRDFNRVQGEWEAGREGGPLATTTPGERTRSAGVDAAVTGMYSPPGTPGTEGPQRGVYGDPVAPGQELAPAPLNTATFEKMDIRLEKSPTMTEGHYYTSLATSLGDAAHEQVLAKSNDPQLAQRAKELAQMGTKNYNNLSDEEKARYDADSKRIFGVSGEDYRGMRGLIFYNNEAGNPPGFIPENAEELEFFIKAVPDEQAGATTAAVLDNPNNASPEQLGTAAKTMTESPMAMTRMGITSPEKLDQLLGTFSSIAYEGTGTDSYVSKVSAEFGIPENTYRETRAAIEADPQNLDGRSKRTLSRITEKAQSILTSANRKAKKSGSGSSSTSGTFTVADGISMARAREEEIYNEISQYVKEGPGALSPEVLASIPDSLIEGRDRIVEEDRFDKQFGLESQRIGMEKRKTDAYIESLKADMAYKYMTLEFDKRRFEAQAAAEEAAIQDPEAAMFFAGAEMANESYQSYIDPLLKEFAGNPAGFTSALQMLRDKDSVFRDIEKLRMEALALFSGKEIGSGEPGEMTMARLIPWINYQFGTKTVKGENAPPSLFSTAEPPPAADKVNLGAGGGTGGTSGNVKSVIDKY